MVAKRVNDTHMKVSWTALSPEKAGGCITDYTVHYASDSGLPRTTTTHHNVTSVVIGGLVAGESYTVQVSARNGAGDGPTSESATLSDPAPGDLPPDDISAGDDPSIAGPIAGVIGALALVIIIVILLLILIRYIGK